MNHPIVVEPYELVESPEYFRRVLANMTPPGAAGRDRVKFGNNGHGVWPNYQIEKPSGTKIAYLGSNHRPNRNVKEYPSNELSPQEFDYEGVQQMLARLLK